MKILLLIILISVSSSCLSQTGCSNFRTGKLMYKDSTGNIITVTRKDKKQEEFDKKNNITSKFKIKWLSDCEYQLTQTWSSNKARRKQNRSSTVVVITQTYGEDRYDYGCKCTGDVKERNKGTMVRVN